MLQQPPLTDFSPSAMSAECEAVPPQPLAAKTLPSASPRPSSTKPQEHLGPSGISYEGRVSVIPPLAAYEATMHAAIDLERANNRDNQLAMDTARLHNEHHFANIQQEYHRRMFEQHSRMQQDHNQLFPIREEQLRQAYPQPPEICTLKEEPATVGYDQGNEVNESQVNENSSLFPLPLPGNTKNSINHSPHASHSQVKEEPQDQEAETQRSEGENAKPSNFQRPDQQADPTQSPINKAGESPDLPTDSARIQASEEQPESFRNMENYKHNDSLERMSPFEEDYQADEARMPEGEDTMDSTGLGSEGDMDHLSRLQQAMELSGLMAAKEGEAGDKPQVYQCHLCTYSGTSRFHFNDHLNTHYDHKCAKCEFTARTEPKLREHMQQDHGLNPDSTEDLEGIRVPRVNAQGKVKTFKCKQCDYVAITKSDFWEHARSHIKNDKLLTCPKCPFVTEYKHHLEYHLRNHYGSKPFKCNKCNYSCVNKSMLNSHMKSHSNIYQYRCSDCTYATKYCHSLKLHLRKYGHNPAMVLNPDGSPNPIPIIDVYGTRRGPKLKKDDKGMPILPPHYQIQAQLLKAQMQASGTMPLGGQPMDNTQPPTPNNPPQFPPTSHAGPPHSPFSYVHPTMMDNFPNSSPILTKALRKSPEELPRSQEGREQIQELLDRERLIHKISPLSPNEIRRCSFCEFVTESREVFAQHMAIHASSDRREEPENIPHSPIPMETSISPEHRPLSPPRPLLFQHQPPPPPLTSNPPNIYSPLAAAQLKEYLTRAMNPFYQHMVSGQFHPAFGLQQHLQRFGHPVFQSPRPTLAEEDHHQLSPKPMPEPQPITRNVSPPLTTDCVLDLSKEQTPLLSLAKEQTPPQQVRDTSKEPPPLQPQRESRSSLSPNHSSPQSSSPTRSETSTPPSKNRRKGRAFKLERIALRLSESAEGESSGHDDDARKEEESQSKPKDSRMPPLMPLEHLDAPQEQWQSAYHCQYCDMAFKDVVMYTMHMGYHGFGNPFTCNMCGHEATDKVAFFLHIARSSHS